MTAEKAIAGLERMIAFLERIDLPGDDLISVDVDRVCISGFDEFCRVMAGRTVHVDRRSGWACYAGLLDGVDVSCHVEEPSNLETFEIPELAHAHS